MPKLSLSTRRVTTLFGAIPFALFTANWTAGWDWFGRFDTYCAILSIGLFELLLFLVWPGPDSVAKLSFDTRRTMTLIAAVPIVICAINWFMGWHWFGRNDQGAMALFLMVFIPFTYVVGPSPDEIREHNEKKNRSSEQGKG